MKLVTFNIRCDYEQDGVNNFNNRKPYLLKKIQAESPDIICFQEVLPHVAVWLKDNLSDYYMIGCGRDEKLQNEQTSIAYKYSKLNLIEMEVFWLSETPKVPGSRYRGQSDCPRICTLAMLQDLETNQVVRIYNTHLDHIGSEARKLGLSQILNRIDQDYMFTQAPTIITGDFNAFPNSPEMEPLTSHPQFIDLTLEIGGTFHDFGRLAEPDKIDYILAQDNILCNQISIWNDCINGVYLSDHYPVCAELQIE